MKKALRVALALAATTVALALSVVPALAGQTGPGP